MYYHGGGTVLGVSDDSIFTKLAETYCVFSISYPLAPEHPYPSNVDNAYAGLVFAHEHAFALGADPAKGLTVMGVSAGGLFAALVALKAKSNGYPPLAHQVLVAPMTFPSLVSHSYLESWDAHVLDAKLMAWFWYNYLGQGATSAATCARDSKCAPLAASASELAGLPRTTVFVGTLDVLKDEGVEYHGAMVKAGVNSTLVHVEHSHMFAMYGTYLERVRRYI